MIRKLINLFVLGFLLFPESGLLAEKIVLTKVKKVANHEALAKIPAFKYCNNPPAEEITELRKDVASGRAGHTPESESEFFKADILQIPFEYDASTCDANCRSAIRHTTLLALGLWRSGCSRCESENLKVVSIGGSYWVDSISLAKWRYALDNGIFEPDQDPDKISRRSYRPLGMQPAVDFVNVDNHSIIRKLCQARDTINIESEIKMTLCDQSPDRQVCTTGACLQLPIQVGKSYSDCEMNSDTIACGTPDRSIGLNTEDYTFTHSYDGSRKPDVAFGTGSKKIPLLYAVVHEMGHWFGLPHDNYTNNHWPVNIMNNGYLDKKPWCISEWNLIQLDNAVDLGWTPRINQNSGLIYISK